MSFTVQMHDYRLAYFALKHGKYNILVKWKEKNGPFSTVTGRPKDIMMHLLLYKMHLH